MVYLLDFLITLKKIIGYYPFHFILLTIAFTLYFVIKHLYFYESKDLNYKIYNKKLNIIQCSIYIILFIGLILLLRYCRLGFKVELIPLYEKCINFIHKVPLLYSIIFIELIIIGLLLLIIMKKHLAKELWKRHLFLYFTFLNNRIKRLLKKGINPLTIPLEQENSYYNFFIDKFSAYWSYKSVSGRIQNKLFLEPAKNFSIYKNNYSIFYKVSSFFLNIIPQIILIFILLYEIYFNNFILHYIFYYLPFYFIYSLWRNVTEMLSNTDQQLNFIIYERYYEEDNVIYGNTTENEDTVILEYIKGGFKSYLNILDLAKDKEKWDFFVSFGFIFQQQRRFVKNPKTGLFENYSTGEAIDPKTIIILVDNVEKDYFEKEKRYKDDNENNDQTKKDLHAKKHAANNEKNNDI